VHIFRLTNVELAMLCVDDSHALAVKFEFKRLDSVAAVSVVAVNPYFNMLTRVEDVFINFNDCAGS
jgi:hypothetical protein